jgi:hypothetical protein
VDVVAVADAQLHGEACAGEGFEGVEFACHSSVTRYDKWRMSRRGWDGQQVGCWPWPWCRIQAHTSDRMPEALKRLSRELERALAKDLPVNRSAVPGDARTGL